MEPAVWLCVLVVLLARWLYIRKCFEDLEARIRELSRIDQPRVAPPATARVRSRKGCCRSRKSTASRRGARPPCRGATAPEPSRRGP
jgi:hypothetical protein